jgi:two-component system sensor histidine kinase KdpD
MIGDLEVVPLREIEYRGVTLKEMDLNAVIARKPEVAIVDELAHTNVPGSKNHKRYEDVLDLLGAGISVITAVNIQHLESLNDVVERTTTVSVRETVPDSFLQRADEVVNVDVSVDTLRTRLRREDMLRKDWIVAHNFPPRQSLGIAGWPRVAAKLKRRGRRIIANVKGCTAVIPES